LRNFIIIPDGLQKTYLKSNIPAPSGIYQSVLDEVGRNIKDGDMIWICPANYFGFDYSEQYVGKFYLENILNIKAKIKIFSIKKDYIDTYGNIYFLKEYLIENNLWPLKNVFVFVNDVHFKRTKQVISFFNLSVKNYILVKNRGCNKNICTRLIYYRSKSCHYIYEFIARLYYFIRLSCYG
jgi:hypothetical protein